MSRLAAGWLAYGSAVCCVLLLIASYSERVPSVLIAQPPPQIVQAPFFDHRAPEPPAVVDENSADNEDNREDILPGQFASPGQLSSVYPPYYLPNAKRSDSWNDENGFSWSPYGHYSKPFAVPHRGGSWHIPYPFPDYRNLPKRPTKKHVRSPCTSDCDMHEANSLRRADHWLAEAVKTHMNRIKAAQEEENRARDWLANIRRQVDKMSGFTTPVKPENGRCLPTDKCASCGDSVTQVDCVARKGAWVPNSGTAMDGVTQESESFAKNLKSDIDGLLETMDDAEDKISLSDEHDDAEEKSWMDEEQDKSMKDEASMVEDQEDTIGDDLDKIENDEAESKE